MENANKLMNAAGMLGMKYNVTLVHKDSSGNVKDEREICNLVTDAGKAEAAGLINGATTGAFDWIAIGTGTTAAASGDTALETEITTNGGERAQDGSPTRETTSVTNDTAVVDVTYTFTGSFAVTESGLLDAASTGVLLARQTFAAINVVSSDTLTVTWKIQVS